MKKVSVIAAAVVGALASGVVMAEDKVQEGWQVNGYGHLLYNVGESLQLNETWEHRRDYRAAGAAFSGNPNQVEFTVTKGNNYDNGSWSKYVLKTEYGNNEGGNGRGFYGSSGGNDSHLSSGQLEFKEAYVELGDLSMFAEGTSIWTGKRYLNRQAGIMTKEFWKQSSGIGAGVEYKGLSFANNFGFAVVSADPGDGYCLSNGTTVNGKLCNGNILDDGRSTTLTSMDLYLYGVQALGGSFDFDVKYQVRANSDQYRIDSNTPDAAEDGIGAGITYSRDYYGFDGWSLTGITYGKGIAATKGTNFGNWNGGWAKDDVSMFLTSYGVANITDNIQLGSEIVYWNLDNSERGQVWGATDGVTRAFVGVTPTYRVSDNFRWEAVLTAASETAKGWRTDDTTYFYTATLAPVFTVNADYFGRPQIKPYIAYMTSSDDSYSWSQTSKGNDTRFGIEAEIWF
ncbi:maltoporin [Vibrio variabilis]|uniref:Maltoporin n=1 Tax=Vibrio variabilis TaxID=990271 RepID=A0ABQ0JD59_9VIBR|nr:maltoporin [Vibrio variabilis]